MLPEQPPVLTIDSTRGLVQWGDLTLPASLTEGELRTRGGEQVRRLLHHRVGLVQYSSYALPSLKGSDGSLYDQAYGSVYFENGRCTMLTFSLTYAGELPGWENLSEAGELKRQDLHEAFLREQLGDPNERTPYGTTLLPTDPPFVTTVYQRGWGTVHSGYDFKNGTVGITIRYR
ncbi:MAG: hypothetical protein U0670_23480 [Anaerolineae bacterium]